MLHDNDNKTILNNGTSVGSTCRNCLKDGRRCKLYHKAVHSLEVKNNVHQVGTNISNLCNNTEERLNNTIEETIINVFTMLAIIIYYRETYDGGVPTEKEVLHALEELINLIPEDVIHNTPIKQKQWQAFSEEIKTMFY